MGFIKRAVSVNGQTLEYTLERKQVKNINLRVRKDGSVYASAHPSVPANRVDAFVMAKEPRIRKAQTHFRERKQQKTEPKTYTAGEAVFIMGQPMVLDICQGEKNRVFADGSRLIVEMKNPADTSKTQRLVDGFLYQQCRELFGEIAEKIYPAFQKLGVPMPELRIRSMRSRWGSCMPGKGVITLNRQLLAAPRACIEYVVMHEFCHFIHPNHSKQFYQLLASLLPDWKERKRILNEGRTEVGKGEM